MANRTSKVTSVDLKTVMIKKVTSAARHRVIAMTNLESYPKVFENGGAPSDILNGFTANSPRSKE